MQDEHGWWLRFADSSYPKAEKRGTNGIAYAWEQVNGNWWAFDESGYIKTGWMRDEDYNGWFYLDPEHGMQTGWVPRLKMAPFPPDQTEEKASGMLTSDTGRLLCR